MEKRVLFEHAKERQLDKILEKYGDNISNINDLTAGEDPSLLFYILVNKFGYLLEPESLKGQSVDAIKVRRKIHNIIEKVGPIFLSNPQIIENRYKLMYPTAVNPPREKGIILPKEPVIWAANHAFKDDTLATVLAAYRHAYILFGSLPQFFNTLDGVTAAMNGVVMTNRKVKASRAVSVEKSSQVLKNGADLIMFPEGVWNKTPEKLLIDLWPGIYRIAKETGAKVVPVVHYLRDCTAKKSKDNVIHTVVDDPIRIDNLSEKEGLRYLRDTMATWYYLMMEKYGRSMRDIEISNNSSYNDCWEKHLNERVATAKRYDPEIEFCADYRPKDKVEPEDVFDQIANISNITPANKDHVEYAKQLVKMRNERNYQRRF